jgi:starch-binding outer membrane protein, SusD/RagB family
LLNYAEAVVESSATAKYNAAATAMNATRRRAGHTVDIPLNIQNVMRERKVELAFENKRAWDLIRRREFHELFSGTHRHVLKPLLDLRVNPPQYIFVRGTKAVEAVQIFQPYYYYRAIQGTASSGLIQNPQY